MNPPNLLRQDGSMKRYPRALHFNFRYLEVSFSQVLDETKITICKKHMTSAMGEKLLFVSSALPFPFPYPEFLGTWVSFRIIKNKKTTEKYLELENPDVDDWELGNERIRLYNLQKGNVTCFHCCPTIIHRASMMLHHGKFLAFDRKGIPFSDPYSWGVWRSYSPEVAVDTLCRVAQDLEINPKTFIETMITFCTWSDSRYIIDDVKIMEYQRKILCPRDELPHSFEDDERWKMEEERINQLLNDS